MAIRLTTSGVTTAVNKAKFPLRYGLGYPVITNSTEIVSQRYAVIGDGIDPTTFSILYVATGIPDSSVEHNWVMLSSTQLGFLHALVGGMTTTLELYKILENGSVSNETVATFTSLPTTSQQFYDIAVDSNGIWHVIYIDDVSNMGTNYRTLMYTNKIGGTWKTPVQIQGAPNTISVSEISIQIDTSDIPFVFYAYATGAFWAIGNVNNATSFTETGIGSQLGGSYIVQETLAVDEDGDHWIFGRDGSGNLRVRHHNFADAWTTHSETTISDITFTLIYGVYIEGNYAYVFHKDNTNNPTGVSITKIDISGTNPTYVSTKELTTHDWHDSTGWDALWKTNGLYHNYDKYGIDVGVSSLAKSFDICFNYDDDANSDYEPYWDTFQIAPTISLHTAESSSFSTTTPTLEFTGSEQMNLNTLEYDVQVMTDNLAVVDSYSESNYNASVNINNTNKAIGQSFTGDGKYLTRATFYLSKSGTPLGFAKAKLYEHSGTFGTSSVPTGSPLAISLTTLDVSTLTGSNVLVNFDFDGNFQLVNGTKYVIVFEYLIGDATNYVSVGYDSTSQTHSGNGSLYTTVWASSIVDIIFYVNGHTLLLDRKSDVDTSEFVNTVTGGDTHPFNDAEKIAYTVASGDALSEGNYYWMARARNTSLTGSWSDIRTFDITLSATNTSKIKVSNWKDITSGSIAIGGTWKQIVSCSINIGDVWKPFVPGSL